MNIKYIVALVAVLIIATVGVLTPAGKTIVQQVGSVTGPTLQSPYWEVNGVTEWDYSVPFNNASTTLCSFTAPAATSTLVFGSVNITTGTSTVLTVEIAKGAKNSEATTTLLGTKVTVPDSELQTIVASTTPGSAVIFGPLTRFNVKFGSASALTATANSIKGYCKARFIQN